MKSKFCVPHQDIPFSIFRTQIKAISHPLEWQHSVKTYSENVINKQRN